MPFGYIEPMEAPPASNPAWLGIGAQRSGTTWFVQLLTQHPELSLGRSQRKELHLLQRALLTPVSRLAVDLHTEFSGLATLAGEFTPAYLRCPWVPEAARRLLSRDPVLIVLLRDPVARFASAMSHEMRLGRGRKTRIRTYNNIKSNPAEWAKFRGVDAVWAGMYARHLDSWTRVFPKEQFLVLQYERLASDPQRVMSAVFERLGVGAIDLKDVENPSRTKTPEHAYWSWKHVPWLRDELAALYRPDAERLASEWNIDLDLWRQLDSKSRG